jgi:membrane-associated phospholipid phosphatase
LLLIFLISIQRYTSNMHSMYQIVAGIIFGFCYVSIYKYFNLSIPSFLIIFCIGILLYLSCLNQHICMK